MNSKIGGCTIDWRELNRVLYMMKCFMDEMSYSLQYSLNNCLPLPQCNQHAYTALSI